MIFDRYKKLTKKQLFTEIVAISAAVIIPGGLIIGAGYLLYKDLKVKLFGSPKKTDDSEKK